MIQHQASFVARTFPDGDVIVSPVDTSVTPLPPVLTIAEAAVVLNTTPSSVRAAIANGELPIIRLSGRDRIVSARMMERFYAVERDRRVRVAQRPAG
jgi:excisionase family DNA binding protein